MKELEKSTRKKMPALNLEKYEVVKFDELNAIQGGSGRGVSESDISK